MNFSSIISVSSKDKLNCEKLAEFLGKAGIIVDVTYNITMQPRKEYGCRLVQGIQTKDDVKQTWDLLKQKYNFDCAHINVKNKFDGCILDFLSPTKCISTPKL